MSGLLYTNDLVLCGESEYLKMMVGHFVEAYRRGLKVNAEKRKVIVLVESKDWDVRFM